MWSQCGCETEDCDCDVGKNDDVFLAEELVNILVTRCQTSLHSLAYN